MKRTLALKREALAELSSDELSGVNGAANEQISLPHIVCVILYYTRDFACTANCPTN